MSASCLKMLPGTFYEPLDHIVSSQVREGFSGDGTVADNLYYLREPFNRV